MKGLCVKGRSCLGEARRSGEREEPSRWLGRALMKVLWQEGHGLCSHCRKASLTRVQKAKSVWRQGLLWAVLWP